MTKSAAQIPEPGLVRVFVCESSQSDMHRNPFGMVDSAKPIQQQCAMSQIHQVLRRFGCVSVEIQFEKVQRRW